MFFIETEETLRGETPKLREISDTEYEQCMEYYETYRTAAKKRVKTAFGYKAISELDEVLLQFKCHNAVAMLGVRDWKTMIDEMTEIFCASKIMAKIRFSPKAYRNNITVDELNRLIHICELRDSWYKDIYRTAEKYGISISKQHECA